MSLGREDARAAESLDNLFGKAYGAGASMPDDGGLLADVVGIISNDGSIDDIANRLLRASAVQLAAAECRLELASMMAGSSGGDDLRRFTEALVSMIRAVRQGKADSGLSGSP